MLSTLLEGRYVQIFASWRSYILMPKENIWACTKETAQGDRENGMERYWHCSLTCCLAEKGSCPDERDSQMP